MPKLGRSDIVVAVVVVGALALGALGFAGFTADAANSFLFAAWTLSLLALFMLALRVPLRGTGSRLSAWLTTAFVVGLATAIVVAANVALFRHDVHFDVSREGRNTPPAQLTTVVANLHAPLSLTYFYNAGDPHALETKELIAIAAHGRSLFAFRAIDLDKEPGLARDVGVRAYNTAVLQAGDRKVLVENTTDPTRIAYAAMRALKERVETICFITGHGEPFRSTQAHFHYSHVETLRGHDTPGSGDVLGGRARAARPPAACAHRDRLRDARHPNGVGECHPGGLHSRRRRRSAHGLRCRRDRAPGEISRTRRPIAAAARSDLSGRRRPAKEICWVPLGSAPSRRS